MQGWGKPGMAAAQPGRLCSADAPFGCFMIVLEVIAVVLVADFVSGFFHWMEDAWIQSFRNFDH